MILNTDIEIGLTHFEVNLILQTDPDQADPDDELRPETGQIVSQLGDLWHLDKHRILCGDAREDSNLATFSRDLRVYGHSLTIVFRNRSIDGGYEGGSICPKTGCRKRIERGPANLHPFRPRMHEFPPGSFLTKREIC